MFYLVCFKKKIKPTFKNRPISHIPTHTNTHTNWSLNLPLTEWVWQPQSRVPGGDCREQTSLCPSLELPASQELPGSRKCLCRDRDSAPVTWVYIPEPGKNLDNLFHFKRKMDFYQSILSRQRTVFFILCFSKILQENSPLKCQDSLPLFLKGLPAC